jgi:hypothetical protein
MSRECRSGSLPQGRHPNRPPQLGLLLGGPLLWFFVSHFPLFTDNLELRILLSCGIIASYSVSLANSSLSAAFPSLLAAAMVRKKIGECPIGLHLPAR